eukprot:m.53472 g.53472  ORF g.53472 m.53472 type:complete len:120 (+) comp9156_c0_seq2:34-393(+)
MAATKMPPLVPPRRLPVRPCSIRAAVPEPTASELERLLLSFKQPELVYDLDDILYHSTVRCKTSACLAQPPPKETWVLHPDHETAYADAGPGVPGKESKAGAPSRPSSGATAQVQTSVL